MRIILNRIICQVFFSYQSYRSNRGCRDIINLKTTLITDKSGAVNYQLKVTYTDDYGEHVFTEDLEIFILSQKQSIPLSKKITVIATIFLLVIGTFIYFLKRKRKVNKNVKKS